MRSIAEKCHIESFLGFGDKPKSDLSSGDTRRGLARSWNRATVCVKRLELLDSDCGAVVSAEFSDHARPTRRDLILALLVPRANRGESGKGFWIRDSNHSSMAARVNRQ